MAVLSYSLTADSSVITVKFHGNFNVMLLRNYQELGGLWNHRYWTGETSTMIFK